MIKKLRGKHTIDIDDQIIRWRQKLKKEGVVLGRKAKAAESKNRKQNRALKDEQEITSGRKKWF